VKIIATLGAVSFAAALSACAVEYEPSETEPSAETDSDADALDQAPLAPPPDRKPPAFAGTTGPVTLTAVSGVPGSVYTLGTPTSSVNAVYALLSRERSDDPCHFAIGTENVNTATLDSAPTENLCGPNGPTSSTLHADYLDVNAGGLGDHDFVSGVIVCMNSGDDKVKGISVVGKRVASNGTLTPLPVDGSAPRANCHHWDSWVQCPAGQIATAVDAHFASGNTPRELTGIALHCRAVTP
jgi:hypothetical protein